jgi:hypothetical protein
METTSYAQQGNSLIPELTFGEEKPTYGKYGLLRKRYLKEHCKDTYSQLLLSGKLHQHLLETDELVHNFIFRLVKEMAAKQGVDEALKARDQMTWVGAMNAIKTQVEEVAFVEYVYV